MKGAESYWLTRLLIQRALAFIYLIAFLIAAEQFVPLAGQHGILPISLFLKYSRFWDAPSLFFFVSSDIFIHGLACAGVVLSMMALTGFSERFGTFFSSGIWTLLWIFYMSFVNAGQVFYGFGWEMLLLETGFLAIFLGNARSKPPAAVIWLYRWILFRLMFGAGMIKIRGDQCWRDLTCMDYHYETQPLPNPLSWYLHHLPQGWHKLEVFGTHVIELVMPFAYFIPGAVGVLAGLAAILFHIFLILSGNLSWLNYITIAVAFSCLNDRAISKIVRIQTPPINPPGFLRKGILTAVTGLILFLSITPARNLLSSRQLMNASFDPLHLVNTYGAFGSITRQRREVVLEGTRDFRPGPETVWKEYEFKCKPGNVRRAPCIVSPYHYKLDWQMWFAAMSSYRYHPWILSLAGKLLENDPQTLGLIAGNPFPGEAPRWIRASWYEYHFTTPEERRKTGAWWVRKKAGDYLPPLSLSSPPFQMILRRLGFTG